MKPLDGCTHVYNSHKNNFNLRLEITIDNAPTDNIYSLQMGGIRVQNSVRLGNAHLEDIFGINPALFRPSHHYRSRTEKQEVKYRAVLHDPAATRETKPEQAFSNNPVELEEWAIQTLGRLLNPAPGVEVLIFRTIEKPFRTVPHQRALEIIDQRAQAEAVAAAAANAKKVGFPERADQS